MQKSRTTLTPPQDHVFTPKYQFSEEIYKKFLEDLGTEMFIIDNGPYDSEMALVQLKKDWRDFCPEM